MKVLTRYLLRAHAGPFLFAFVALTGVILINTLAKELANLAGKGLPLDVVLEFFVLSLPANIALTLPMAVLVSVLFTFSTLAAENEITALRASGVDLRRAALPLILLAAIIAGGMVWFNDRVLPTANYRWRVLMTDVAQARPLLYFQPQSINPIPSQDGITTNYLEAQDVDPTTGLLKGVSIYDISESGITRTITADSGRMAFNEQQTDLLLTLFDGEMLEADFNDPNQFQRLRFRQQVLRMQGVSERLERTVGSDYRTDRDMTVGMMQARIDSLRAERDRLLGSANPAAEPAVEPAAELTAPAFAEPQVPSDEVGAVAYPTAGSGDGSPADAASGATVELGYPPVDPAAQIGGGASDGSEPSNAPAAEPAPEPAPDPGQLPPSMGLPPADARYTAARVSNLEFQIREYQVEIQKKFSIAGATLVFVLIGIPLALRFPRGGVGMVIAVSLLIFGIYYVGLIGGETLGDGGYVPPAVAMWATNVIFGFLGLLGFLRLGHEQGSGRGSGWGDWPRFFRSRKKSVA